ncbi:MAG: hypothetical protein J1F40_10170 [Prevotellaceae bacterium]|nr:hypothetical protein [Prevotellaceae bacterium]
MKKWLVFLLGFIAGIVFTFIVAFFIGRSNKGDNNVEQVVEDEIVAADNGMTFFAQPGECLSTNDFEVLQVIEDGGALAQEVKWEPYIEGYIPTNSDLLVFVINDDGEYYYDGQIIKVPQGKCMRQVGIYKYLTQGGFEKTVPIVKIMDK